MTEAERYLNEKLKRDAGVKSGVPDAGGEQKPDETAERQKPVDSGDGGSKVWGVVMGVFAILATMFWMAVFKGGCR